MKIPLHLPQFTLENFDLQRSGIRWLCEDGHQCRPNEALAYCQIGLARQPGASAGAPFPEEAGELQVVLATRAAGRFTRAPDLSRGGWMDLQDFHHAWSAETVIGQLETETLPDDPSLRLLLLCGRRVLAGADVHGGLVPGWYDRYRAWWADRPGRPATVVSLGNCEQLGIIRGERWAFFELFDAVPGPAHMVFFPGDALILPSAAMLCEQLQRTDAERARIVEDMASSFAALIAAENRRDTDLMTDWLFAGWLIKCLGRNPFLQDYDLLTPATGLHRQAGAAAVILSLNSESALHLRHKRLGYLVACPDFRVGHAGPVVKQWLHRDFEFLAWTPEDSRRAYRALLDALAQKTQTAVLVLNAVSSLAIDNTFCYAPFQKPLGKLLPSVRTKELNLMLYELARERDLSIVDVDALAADLGAARHILDGVHQSGALQAAIRGEIVRILAERALPGYASPQPLSPRP